MDTMYNRSIVVPLVLPAALVAVAAATARAGEPASAKLSAADVTRRIDAAVEGRLKAEKVKPATRADDAEFLRRVYLDLTGHVPPAAKAASFLDDRSSDKR